ncbi:hypothetical protein [Amycolatopsis sp. lyj-346]|uniref:hypothetical protein n=1 Tax=Amycolatopsis sp. lyj-346 TaxID=2789289 RepID=UPI003979AFAB
MAEDASQDDDAVFAREVEAGNVWVSGLGLGADKTEVNVLSPDWHGSPELARDLFYRGLDTGQYGIDRARVVRSSRSPQ